jgi:hypothetical protein
VKGRIEKAIQEIEQLEKLQEKSNEHMFKKTKVEEEGYFMTSSEEYIKGVDQVLMIEDLIPYLNYGIKIKVYDFIEFYWSPTFYDGTVKQTFPPALIEYTPYMHFLFSLDNSQLRKIKPVLKPMYELKEKINQYYSQLTNDDLERILKETKKWTRLQSYSYIRWLLKNHFDVFGLIDKGLAIDKNEIWD